MSKKETTINVSPHVEGFAEFWKASLDSLHSTGVGTFEQGFAFYFMMPALMLLAEPKDSKEELRKAYMGLAAEVWDALEAGLAVAEAEEKWDTTHSTTTGRLN